jgi:hypothetical protein
MTSSRNLFSDTELTAQVLASPAYQDRVNLPFELFRRSRDPRLEPGSLLSLQVDLAEILSSWQDKQREFRNGGDRLGIAVARRLSRVLKRIADSIAWRALGYNRLLIELLAEHPKTGFLQKSILSELETAGRLVQEEGATVLVNDLTTVLRYGDLTVVRPDGGLEIVEVKTGARDGRASRQKRRLDELLDFVNTGTRISKQGTMDHIVTVDIPILTHHATVQDLIIRAGETGYERRALSDCLIAEAIHMQQGPSIPSPSPFADNEHVLTSTNLDVLEKATPRLVPYGVFPFDDATCYGLMTGNIYLISYLNFDALVDLFREYGLKLQLPEPSDQEIDDYLSASIAEIRTAQKNRSDRHLRFVIKAGSEYLRLRPDAWGVITLEFIHERTLVESLQQLVRQSASLDVDEGRIERLYWAHRSETAIWT